eukprot:COSAG02_NODE_36412_length_454_cov_67.185915_1_plen_133_part_00
MYRELFLKLRQSVGLGILNRFIYSSHEVNVRNRHYLELLADFDRKSALLRGFYELVVSRAPAGHAQPAMRSQRGAAEWVRNVALSSAPVRYVQRRVKPAAHLAAVNCARNIEVLNCVINFSSNFVRVSGSEF